MKRPTDWLNCTKVYCISWQISIYLYVISLCYFQIAFDSGYVLNGVGNAFSTNRKLIDYSVIFYRATLCVSAVIAVARCMSVGPSVTLVYCIETAADVKLLYRPGSPIILVFRLPAPVPNSKGTPSAGTQSRREWENFAIFDWNRRISRKRYHFHGCYGTLIGNHRWRIDTCRFRWPRVAPTRVSRSLYTYKLNTGRYLKNGAS